MRAYLNNVVSHEFQCNWRVVKVKNGKVTWRCWCGKRQERIVRVRGILPPALLFPRNWPNGIIGCPECATILNAKTSKCKNTWHSENKLSRS